MQWFNDITKVKRTNDVIALSETFRLNNVARNLYYPVGFAHKIPNNVGAHRTILSDFSAACKNISQVCNEYRRKVAICVVDFRMIKSWNMCCWFRSDYHSEINNTYSEINNTYSNFSFDKMIILTMPEAVNEAIFSAPRRGTKKDRKGRRGYGSSGRTLLSITM